MIDGKQMNKEDAKVLLSNIYDKVGQHIDRQDDKINETVLIDFLHEIANSLFENNFKSPLNLYSQRFSFDREYKLLAEKSIHSYSGSNEKFSELAKAQQTVLDNVSTDLFDFDEFSRRFETIQSHLNEEVLKANTTIGQLLSRVKELENKASVDSLTKVYNRRALKSHLDSIFSLEQNNHDLNMHLFMIDIDDFKKVNDTYGHVTGDKVLIFLSNILKKTLRHGDKIFRYGGEEFIIILNRITPEQCKLVAERILNLVRSNKLLTNQNQIVITLSIGSTQFKRGDTMESIIGRADKALYLAKNSGKDQLKVIN